MIFSNILENNEISLTVDVRDPINPFNNIGMMIEGEARLEAEIKIIESPSNRIFLKNSAINAFKMFERKYPMLREEKPGLRKSTRLVKKFSEVLISIKPKKIICWIGGPEFRRIEYQ